MMKHLHSSVSATLVFACVCVISVNALQYSDIEMLGVQSCPGKNSCPSINVTSGFIHRNCECDRQCFYYDDCCIDAPSRSRLKSRLICLSLEGEYTGMYAIGHCPTNYVGSTEVINQCQNNNMSDPILSAPVTDARNRKTYINSYCAICHDAPRHLKMWIISVDCPDTPDNFTWSDLAYRFGRWSVRLHHRTYPCQLTFKKPTDVSAGSRQCRANLISSCPSTWQRETFINACKSYTSMVRVRNGESELLYRNPHCAVCNGHTVDQIECFHDHELDGRKKAKPFSFALLLDVNRSNGDLVGVTGESCPTGQRYDPFFKKCREVVCGIPGYQLVDGKCVKA